MTNPNRNSLTDVEVRTASASKPQKLTIKRADLDWAASQGLVTSDQAGKLWHALVERSIPEGASRFDLVHLAYYGGASIVLIAMTIFIGLITAQYQAPALVATAIVYGAAFLGLGQHLYFRRNLEVPGGLMYTLAVATVPVIIFGIMNLNGLNSVNSSQELVLEVATVVASVVALTFVRFPFLTMPMFTALWLMSITVTNMVSSQGFFWGDKQLVVSMIFGALMTAVSVGIDRRTEKDFAFWGYLFGVSSFWLSLTFFDKGGQAGMLAYFAVNVILMLASVVLNRRIFLVTGGLGATGYLMYLAYDIFQSSMAFPIALCAIGVGVIFIGIKYHKNKDSVDAFIMRHLPSGLSRLPRRD